MTKWFLFDSKHPYDLVDDFDEFFGDQSDYFTTELTYTFEVSVANEQIRAVRCSLNEGVASFEIWWADYYTRPAGTANVSCTTELLNEFWDRIYNPEAYRGIAAKWEI